jgi:peptidoglycan/xylan/chitin deacetylase (PgdA/CDA1 family)
METTADQAERIADGSQLGQLPPELITIGSHTVTHPYLTSLSNEAVREELVNSMTSLSALTGRDIRLLAFPYGDHDSRVVGLSRSSGYQHVFTSRPKPVRPTDGVFARGRIAVDPTDGTLEFFLKATGSYEWMLAASAIKRWLER